MFGATGPICLVPPIKLGARLVAARSANDAGAADFATLSNGELQPVKNLPT